MLVGSTVGGFFKFRFLQAGKLSDPEPESSAKGFRRVWRASWVYYGRWWFLSIHLHFMVLCLHLIVAQ